MGFGYDVIAEGKRVNALREENYEKYCNEMSSVKSRYMELRDIYNHRISTIDSERTSMRSEIRTLEKFLKNIGEVMADKISIFDFREEHPPVFEDYILMAKPDKLILEEMHPFVDPIIKTLKIMNENKKRIQEYELEIEAKRQEYNQDVSKFRTKLKFLEDATDIAEIYLQTVVIVKDTIKEKIIPELGLIKAYLYAESLKEIIIDGETPSEILPASISECEGTLQDVHYQFVKNVFDFYVISTNFFKNSVLSNIIDDMQVTEDEKLEFNSQLDSIKQSIQKVAEKKVL